MQTAPAYVMGNLDNFDKLGEKIEVNMVLDVVILLGKDNSMMHYAGVWGGWKLYKQLPDMDREKVLEYIRDWKKTIYEEEG